MQQLVGRSARAAISRLGLSPRAAQGLVRAARAWALIDGRDAVLPDDVQVVWPAVVGVTASTPRDAPGGAERRNATREILDPCRSPTEAVAKARLEFLNSRLARWALRGRELTRCP